MNNRKGVKLRVDIPQNLIPVFSDLAEITHNDQEFNFTFMHVIPRVNTAKVKAIVTLTPIHAKRFLLALQENIKKYETKYGEIKLPEKDKREVFWKETI